ncbi:hypothetical protein BDW75DRAFT_245124 [Aspergillus navahoensis]
MKSLHSLFRVSFLAARVASAVAIPTEIINIPAVETQPPRESEPGAAPALVNSATSGTPTTTGALHAETTLAQSIAPQPNPMATYYNPDGRLTKPQPMPYMPAGGGGTNGTIPVYMVQSDFDYQSVALGVHQEYIELDLFHYGLERFSDNMLGELAPKQYTYDYPFTTVREFLSFNVKLTRGGESGNWGFLSHLDS